MGRGFLVHTTQTLLGQGGRPIALIAWRNPGPSAAEARVGAESLITTVPRSGRFCPSPGVCALRSAADDSPLVVAGAAASPASAVHDVGGDARCSVSSPADGGRQSPASPVESGVLSTICRAWVPWPRALALHRACGDVPMTCPDELFSRPMHDRDLCVRHGLTAWRHGWAGRPEFSHRRTEGDWLVQG